MSRLALAAAFACSVIGANWALGHYGTVAHYTDTDRLVEPTTP